MIYKENVIYLLFEVLILTIFGVIIVKAEFPSLFIFLWGFTLLSLMYQSWELLKSIRNFELNIHTEVDTETQIKLGAYGLCLMLFGAASTGFGISAIAFRLLS